MISYTCWSMPEKYRITATHATDCSAYQGVIIDWGVSTPVTVEVSYLHPGGRHGTFWSIIPVAWCIHNTLWEWIRGILRNSPRGKTLRNEIRTITAPGAICWVASICPLPCICNCICTIIGITRCWIQSFWLDSILLIGFDSPLRSPLVLFVQSFWYLFLRNELDFAHG